MLFPVQFPWINKCLDPEKGEKNHRIPNRSVPCPLPQAVLMSAGQRTALQALRAGGGACSLKVPLCPGSPWVPAGCPALTPRGTRSLLPAWQGSPGCTICSSTPNRERSLFCCYYKFYQTPTRLEQAHTQRAVHVARSCWEAVLGCASLSEHQHTPCKPLELCGDAPWTGHGSKAPLCHI